MNQPLPKTPNRFFIFAGELSGDLHGSHLIKELKRDDPSCIIEGVCGPAMRTCPISCILQMESFEVMGLTDVLMALPKLIKQFYLVRDHILKSNPDAVILIDYPGFNLRLAKHLRRLRYKGKIVQYISPTVWAWGSHRIESMAQTLDLLLTIYPFEKHYFAHSSLNVEFMGNPLCEYINAYSYKTTWRSDLKIDPNKNLIAMFPGSRTSEIKRHLPLMLETAKRMHQEFPDTLFALSESSPGLLNLPKDLPEYFIIVPKHYTYELMKESTLAIAKSGTVSLELALHRCPTVVIYKITPLNRLYAKYFLKLSLPYYCIANILKEDLVFPELIEKECTTDLIVQHAKQLYANKSEQDKVKKGCQQIIDLLTVKSPSKHAAETILRLLPC